MPIVPPHAGDTDMDMHIEMRCYKDNGFDACYKLKEECIQTCQTRIKHRAEHVAASDASKAVIEQLLVF